MIATLNALLKLQLRDDWEIRHGGLLGVKYVVIVRRDLASAWLPLVVPAVLNGLRDVDDEVRAVAADTLLPIADLLVGGGDGEAAGDGIGNEALTVLVSLLWNTLSYLDDLTVSTRAILALLADLYTHAAARDGVRVDLTESAGTVGRDPLDDFDDGNGGAAVVGMETDGTDRDGVYAVLVPRLFPFLRHNLASVRLAACNVIAELVGRGRDGHGGDMDTDGASDPLPVWLSGDVLRDTARHLFQNLLMDDSADVSAVILELWTSVLRRGDAEALAGIIGPFCSSSRVEREGGWGSRPVVAAQVVGVLTADIEIHWLDHSPRSLCGSTRLSFCR